MVSLRVAADRVLEASVAGSFSRIGPSARRRLQRWTPHRRTPGRVVAVTGATSGLGRQMAWDVAALGCDLILLVRDPVRGQALADELAAVHAVTATVIEIDMGRLDSVRAAAAEVLRLPRLDVLIHNAGALSAELQITEEGNEQTFAVHVLGPFLLSHLLLPALQRSGDARIIVVTSGGMYTEALNAAAVEMRGEVYSGTKAYARCKRAQVALADMLAPQLARQGILLAAYHPGWADTEGVRTSLPRFRAVMRPLLRSPAEGADTGVWLATAERDELRGGPLWLDRAPRPLHRLRRTQASDTAAERRRLIALCLKRCRIAADQECA